jgi:hypothetical protein
VTPQKSTLNIFLQIPLFFKIYFKTLCVWLYVCELNKKIFSVFYQVPTKVSAKSSTKTPPKFLAPNIQNQILKFESEKAKPLPLPRDAPVAQPPSPLLSPGLASSS